ncbi:protein kinase [bacterium]|nr:protein kinase [bacterium]
MGNRVDSDAKRGLLGQTIGHYRLIRVLGQGGMGIVYKAEDTALDRTVAIKFLSSEKAPQQDDRTRFVREAKTAASLNHPALCTIHEIGEWRDRIYFVMEYVEGKTLKDILAAPKAIPFTCSDILSFALQLIDGLQAAHAKHIIHRDIKPANIMITPPGRIKIMDFGLARCCPDAHVTKSSATMGTVAYMSPEQARGDGVDYRSDIWSLGVVLYEIICGRRPFRGDYDQVVLYSILHENPDPIGRINSDCPLVLKEFVEGCLKKDPEKRIAGLDAWSTRLWKSARLLPSPEQIAPGIVRHGTRKPAAALKMAAGIALPILLLVLLLLGRENPLAAFSRTQPQSVAVLEFENHTGAADYDYLTRAVPNLIITSLGRVSRLQVIPWRRLMELQRQDSSIAGPPDESVWLALCRQHGIDAAVVGSVIRTGDLFATDVKVYDPKSSGLIVSADSRGSGIESILREQVDDLSGKIIEGLGVSEGLSLSRIVDVTTTDLEAYRCYLAGRDFLYNLRYEAARRSLEKAVRIDTSFAIAYQSLALAYFYLGDVAREAELTEKAMSLIHRATEREQFNIRRLYANIVEDDVARDLAITKEWIRNYPNDIDAHVALIYLYGSELNQPRQCIAACRDLLGIDPENVYGLNMLGFLYAYSGERNKALELFTRYAGLDQSNPNPHESMGYTHLLFAEREEAATAFRRSVDKDPAYGSGEMLAYTRALMEDWPGALETITAAIAAAPTPGRKASAFIHEALYLGLTGQYTRAFLAADSARARARAIGNPFLEAQSWIVSAMLHLDRGETGRCRGNLEYAMALADTVRPKDPFFIGNYQYLLGVTALQEGLPEAAATRLERLRQYVSDPRDRRRVRLEAGLLLENGMIEDAQRCVEKEKPWTNESPFSDLLTPNFPLNDDMTVRVRLAAGDTAAAIRAYDRLLTYDVDTRFELIPPRLYYRKARLCEIAGRVKEAEAAYRTYITTMKPAVGNSEELTDAEARLARIDREMNTGAHRE